VVCTYGEALHIQGFDLCDTPIFTFLNYYGAVSFIAIEMFDCMMLGTCSLSQSDLTYWKIKRSGTLVR
jgi:predicted branched-subunit amino acid permease